MMMESCTVSKELGCLQTMAICVGVAPFHPKRIAGCSTISDGQNRLNLCARIDVECTFGILKKRWRILKNGIYLSETQWLLNAFGKLVTHYLLEIDGLDKRWKEGVKSPYQEELGMFDEEDVRVLADHDRNRDTSGLGVGDDDV